MDQQPDYAQTWERIYRETYAAGKRHWRPELATPPAFRAFMRSPWAPSKGQSILEAGCGDGLNAIALARAGYRVTGVDVSPSAIARAREAAADAAAAVDFLCLDLVRDPLPHPGAFDLWVEIKTLHCLWHDEDRRRYLASAAFALRPHGTLFMNAGLALADVRDHFPSVFASLDAPTRAQADTLDRNLPPEKRQGIRCETLQWYCRELETAGFAICDARRQASLAEGWGVLIVAKKKAPSPTRRPHKTALFESPNPPAPPHGPEGTKERGQPLSVAGKHASTPEVPQGNRWTNCPLCASSMSSVPLWPIQPPRTFPHDHARIMDVRPYAHTRRIRTRKALATPHAKQHRKRQRASRALSPTPPRFPRRRLTNSRRPSPPPP